MCGIAGIVGENAAEHRQAVERMLGALVHRGPDGDGIWVSPGGQCVLGHRRLAILDLTELASQPAVSNDGRFALVYNGECYNFEAIRRGLETRGCRFRSTGDTEVVLQALTLDGPAALPSLNAMYALALWDERERRLLVARDRFGQKPLYWTRVGGNLLFASEVRALLASGLVARQVDPDALCGYLCQGAVQGPRTIVKDVSLLPRATSMAVRPGEAPELKSFWDPPRDKRRAAPGEIRETLQAAVGRHLVSDVPVGLFLSGGIDSSAVAAAATRAAGAGVTSLSVVFPEQPEQSEAEHARRMAEHAGTNHVEIPMTEREMLGILDATLAAMDQPTIDAVNTYIVSMAARQAGLTVALSGLGGDELFGGYPAFADTSRLLRMRRLLGPGRGLARRVLLSKDQFALRGAKMVDLLDAPADLLSVYLVRRRMLSSRQVRTLAPALATDGWIGGLPPERKQALEALIADRASGDAVGHLELEHYMGQTLLRDTDVMGMAHSLEIRVPFLDNDFSDLALRQPADVRVPRKVPKWALTEAISEWLPESVWKRAKQGFSLPWSAWLLGDLRHRVGEGIEALHERAAVFDREQLRVLWNDFQQRPSEIGWSRPWSLFALGEYLRRNDLSP